MDLLYRWLFKCTIKHSRCALHVEPALPTRLLDLAANASGLITLRETKGETGRYICLSYCWGKSEFLKTTRDNLERHKQGIKLDQLPQTFQDVVHIARVLGVRYVWAGSLCIIQNDRDNADWKRESGRMANVYRDSYLTVAATWADSANVGCFTTPRHGDDLGTVMIRQLDQFPTRATPQASIHFPLLARAWAYQEYMLAPRVIHFGRQEML